MRKIYFILIALLLLEACADGGGGSVGESAATKVSYHKLAREKFERKAPFDSVLALQQKAVEELRAGTSPDRAVGVLQQMGYYYTRSGQYGLGADFLLEAVDSLNRLTTLDEEDRLNAAYLFGNLSNLYVRMGMYDEALESNKLGLQYSEGLDNMLACNLWRMRGNLFEHMEMPDSLLRCYDMAMAETHGNRRLIASVVVDRGEYIIMHSDKFSTDEVRETLRVLENSDYECLPMKDAAKFAIGKGKIMFGDTIGGLKIMEEVLESTRERQDFEMLQFAEKHLLTAYAKTGRVEKLAPLFPEYDALCDTLMNREKIYSVMTSEFRFRTKEKELETQMWKERSVTARKIIILQWLAIVLAVILAGLFTFTIMRKLRAARKSKEQMHQRLLSLLAHQKEVNTTIETLNSHIEDLNKVIESRNDNENIQKLIEWMPSCLLSDAQESLFRRYFSQIYPRFIPNLRRDYPSITSNDELVAMLIYMKYSSEEIALSLGISRQSVNSARYRLRKKLDLDKETDLDSFLTSRKG